MCEERGWIYHNANGFVSLDGSGVKIMHVLEPQGEPDMIVCDGKHYKPERTCHPVRRSGKSFSEEEKKTTLDACCSECRGFLGEAWEVFECECDLFCSSCGAKVVE